MNASEPNGDDTPEAPEHPEARKECDKITGAWSWKGFKQRTQLDAIVGARLKEYNSAQILLAHASDIDQTSKCVFKPAALLHRLTKPKHPPSDQAMTEAKSVLDRGDVPLFYIPGGTRGL